MLKKRKPGGGRKPKGDFSGLASPLSIRMPEDMRKKLKAAASGSGKSTTQELLGRLSESLREPPNFFIREDLPTHDLCYLIEKMTRPMRAPARADLGWKQTRTWQNDKFLFLAFKAAISELLDRLAPAGEIDPDVPETLRLVARGTSGLSGEDAAQYDTPEKYAHLTVQGFWHWFMTTERPDVKADAEILHLPPDSHSYRFPKIRETFGIPSRGEKK